MVPLIEMTVHGHPAPQGSKRHVGRGIMVESSKYLAPWRDAVRTDAVLVCAAQPDWTPLNEPLEVVMVFSLPRPASHYRTGRNAHLRRATAPQRPLNKPDVSKLARSTEDALTDAGVWKDDALVVGYRRLAKVYVGEDPDALISPGVRIRIYRLGDDARCTGIVSRWCPVHGDCLCPIEDIPGSHMAAPLDSPGCPLHGSQSQHLGAAGALQ